MRLLLISNSTNAGEAYLEHPLDQIKTFLGSTRVKALFVPYAGVTISFDDYTSRVSERFQEIGHAITSVHEVDDPVLAVQQAEAIVVGGGNTFHLAKLFQQFPGLILCGHHQVIQVLPVKTFLKKILFRESQAFLDIFTYPGSGRS